MIDTQKIEEFLTSVDKLFPVPLSKKQNLKDFARKLNEKATICTACEDNKIVSMVAGYTEDIVDNMAYISIVASLPNTQGRGYASSLVKKFIQICKEKTINAIHLYTAKTNVVAIKMYRKLGFIEWKIPNEPRIDDLHLIYYIGEKQ
ncbi:MAG: GNAT family N-acetyltransferase [Clostridia bacterium]|nr:GNAT family N-acetyltransferase [Clostridia bacterium]